MEIETILERLEVVKVLLEQERLNHRKVFKVLCALIEELQGVVNEPWSLTGQS